MSDAASRASGLTIRLAAEATGLSEEEAYRCIRGIVSFTGDPIVTQDGQKMWLYQNYEPRSIGGAAQGISRLLPKIAISEVASRSRKRGRCMRTSPSLLILFGNVATAPADRLRAIGLKQNAHLLGELVVESPG